jgi:hypothetical protein
MAEPAVQPPPQVLVVNELICLNQGESDLWDNPSEEVQMER